MNKVVIFTVIYPEAESFVDDFLDSVSNQTFKDFDLLIVNDGYKARNLQTEFPNAIVIEGNNCISGNRALGINYTIQKRYEVLILCDVDDYMKPHRVEESIKALNESDIVVNDLDIVDSERKLLFKSYFKKSINENTLIDKVFIERKNILGFSNTALKVSKLHQIEFPKELRIVDWYYFTLLLNYGLKANFLPLALTEYRQHSGNMIGITSYTINGFRRLLKLKIQHYSLLKGIINGYNELLSEAQKLEQVPDEQLKIIIDNNSKLTPYPLWWQNVKL